MNIFLGDSEIRTIILIHQFKQTSWAQWNFPQYIVSCFVHLSLGVSSWITSTQKDYVFRHHCCPGLRTVLFCFQRCFLRTACHPLLLLLIVFGLSVVSDSDSTECSPPGSSVHGDSPGKNIGVFAMSSSSGSSQPRDQTRLPHCRWILYCLRRKGSAQNFLPYNILQLSLILYQKYKIKLCPRVNISSVFF